MAADYWRIVIVRSSSRGNAASGNPSSTEGNCRSADRDFEKRSSKTGRLRPSRVAECRDSWKPPGHPSIPFFLSITPPTLSHPEDLPITSACRAPHRHVDQSDAWPLGTVMPFHRPTSSARFCSTLTGASRLSLLTDPVSFRGPSGTTRYLRDLDPSMRAWLQLWARWHASCRETFLFA